MWNKLITSNFSMFLHMIAFFVDVWNCECVCMKSLPKQMNCKFGVFQAKRKYLYTLAVCVETNKNKKINKKKIQICAKNYFFSSIHDRVNSNFCSYFFLKVLNCVGCRPPIVFALAKLKSILWKKNLFVDCFFSLSPKQWVPLFIHILNKQTL